MKRRTAVLFLFLSWSWLTAGQSLPYDLFRVLDECSKEAQRTEGIQAGFHLQHTRPGDQREYQLWLETSGLKKPIRVNPRGTFELPLIPERDQPKAKITHSLEAGALTVTFAFHWSPQLVDRSQPTNETIFSACTNIAKLMARMEPVIAKVSTVLPEFASFEFGIVGITFPKEKLLDGFVRLKSGEKTVATLDLSKPGRATWLFKDYDPKSHRIEFDLKGKSKVPPVFIEVRSRDEIENEQGTIWLRKKP